MSQPRAGDAPAASSAPLGGEAAGPNTAADPSPRADGAGKDGVTGDPPGSDAAAPGLTGELNLDDLLPAADPSFGGAGSNAVAQGGAPLTGEAAAGFGEGSGSRWPLTAGLLVTLLITFFGGGFLWWHNRDSRYFPA